MKQLKIMNALKITVGMETLYETKFSVTAACNWKKVQKYIK